MNIGIVTTWFERGAAYVSKQYKSLLEEGSNVFIYARGGTDYGIDDPAWDGPEVTWSNRKVVGFRDTRIDLEEFTNWIKKNDISVVFFNEQWWWPAIAHARKLNVVVGAYIDYYTEETRPFFNLYDFLICNTHRHYQAFDWHEQVFYVPWGTDTALFKPEQSDLVNGDQITFFHSAGMSPVKRKGTDILIEAYNSIADNQTKLIIHTQVSLSEKLSSQHHLILEQLMERGQIEVIHDTVGAPGLYHLGDVYVYPTKLEGIGLTILEALSCGLPVIVPDQPPMNEFIDESNGKLVPIERQYARADGYYWPQCAVKAEDLAKAMLFFVDNVKSIPQLKKKVRQDAIDRFDWKNRRQDIQQIFNAVVKREVDPSAFPREITTDNYMTLGKRIKSRLRGKFGQRRITR